MKANIKQDSAFKPFTIEVEIESEQDLYDLWHRLNISYIVVNENSSEHRHACSSNTSTNILWNLIDNKINSLMNAG